MANYVKFKQGLKKDFNTTNQPLTNGMIYFVIDENNNGSIYYDTVVDGKTATKTGTVHRVKFSGLPIKITGSVTGTGVISQDGETIEINTSTNHSHGLAHQDFTVTLSNDDTNLKWTRLGNQNGEGFWLKSIKGNVKAPAWFQPNYGAGIAFGGGSTKGIISVKYNEPSIRFAGGNGDAPVWYFTITGANDKTYDLSKIGGHSSDSAKLDHNITFKISKVANATTGEAGVTTNLTEKAITFTIPSDLSGFNNIQSTRFQGTADNADTVDYFHASEIYRAATHTINNYSSVNDWVRIATINIGGTGLAMGGFTVILSNRECLDGSSFILTVAIRRNSTTSVSCQAFYTPIGSSSPREITIRSNDGVNFYVYFKSVLNSWTTYYNVTKIMTENNVTFENIGVSSANLIAGSVLNVTAVKGGFVGRATDADTLDGYHADAFVKKAGDTMTGHLKNNSEFITTSLNGFRISVASSTNTKSMLLRNDGSDFYILCCNSATAGDNWYIPTGGAHPLKINLTTGYSYFSKVYGAVWNDYAEYRSTPKVKPGQCVIETGKGDLIKSSKRLQPGANIVSDTFGFAIGETEQTKTPLAVSGRVLAYPYEDRNSYQAGDPVCSGPNGTISKMTREEVREYPERIIGTVSEIPDYEVWGTGNVKVNNRIWIKVK